MHLDPTLADGNVENGTDGSNTRKTDPNNEDELDENEGEDQIDEQEDEERVTAR